MHLVTFEPLEAPTQLDPSALRAGSPLHDLELGRIGRRRVGAVMPPGAGAGDIVDLNRALVLRLAEDDVGAPEVEADSLLPSNMLGFLRQGSRAVDRARELLAWTLEAIHRYDAPDLTRSGVLHSRRTVGLCAPLPQPGKIIAVARNYAAHAAERGAEAPRERPVLFLKSTSSVVGPEDDVLLPPISKEVDYEGELAVVIGRPARHVATEDALSFVAGYTIANDVTARDLQAEIGFIAKSCDHFCPMGPYLVTSDAISDPQDLGIRTVVSGELRQDGRTKEMIFGVAEMISFASELMTLEIGDVLLTGTPSGVGAAADPPRYLHEGDVVDIEIEKLGRLRSYVRRAAGQV